MWGLIAVALAGSADLGLGISAIRGPGRHLASGTVGMRLQLDRGPGAWVIEVQGRRRTVRADAFEHRAGAARLVGAHAWVVEVARTRSSFILGPAVELRTATIAGRRALRLVGGLRSAVGLSLPLYRGLGLRFQGGVLVGVFRGLRVDHDLVAGPEIRW